MNYIKELGIYKQEIPNISDFKQLKSAFSKVKQKNSEIKRLLFIAEYNGHVKYINNKWRILVLKYHLQLRSECHELLCDLISEANKKKNQRKLLAWNFMQVAMNRLDDETYESILKQAKELVIIDMSLYKEVKCISYNTISVFEYDLLHKAIDDYPEDTEIYSTSGNGTKHKTVRPYKIHNGCIYDDKEWILYWAYVDKWAEIVRN